MFTVFWMTLLFFLWGSTKNTVESALGKPDCNSEYCITLNDGEITAEAGLCVVIPCFFTTAYEFTPKNIVWFKCEPLKRRCGDSDIVFHINRNKVPSEFLGRVLLLDPDVSQGNCSIMINDLSTSDSGSYQLRVNGFYYGTADGVTFPSRTILSVKALNQRPSLKISPLTEGQQATLTCTAPGLCSGSPPNITWMWRGKTEDYHITGSTPALKTDNLTAVTQRHSSTLTFKPSAKHHNTNVTCKVSFTSGITIEETLSLNISLLAKILKGSGCVQHSEVLTCVCISEGFPSPTITWPLLKDHTEYSVVHIVSNHTVNSTLSLRNPGNISVECFSSNENWEVKKDLMVHRELSEEADHEKHCVSLIGVLPWAIGGVSLCVHVFCIIYIWHLWNTRKKTKLTEDQTYVSLQKRDTSAEYDVIVQRPG
ncbi:sialic acid-binding Ig-like lectin 14 [Poecilia reticulata]|uniref:Sialic acid-binding Ig-like lectin 14 n=1 Tax=Poecilia reticulata TaxID=8081 RepID=A0A3P9PLZ9_POERE|nr:PREDICTED: sialic acid-binding Ig-like lectin 14 [Poecilia reticulata]